MVNVHQYKNHISRKIAFNKLVKHQLYINTLSVQSALVIRLPIVWMELSGHPVLRTLPGLAVLGQDHI